MAMRLRPLRRTWRLICAALVLAMTGTLISASAANAEVEHPRQQWLRNSTAGLFLHWGMFTAPLHLDCAQWDHDVTAGGWTPDYWVDEARKLGAAYTAYKGRQVDLTTRPGFGQFSYDLFFEVMANYPDLGGFWIDNDNEYWEQNHLYEQIRQLRPSWLLSNNNEDTPIMDTVS